MSEPRHDLIGIGASAGGINALLELLPLLEPDLPATVFVVVHRHPSADSSLVSVLSRGARLRVREPEGGDPLVHGVVYVAPRDQHMTVVDGVVWLDRSPRQHHTRPAIDPLGRSLAGAGTRAAGALLSGTMSDGVAGLIAIRVAGGFTIAQEPLEALHPSLPMNAIRADDVQRVLRLRDMAPVLDALARGVPGTDGARRNSAAA